MLNVCADVPVMAAANFRVLHAVNRPALDRAKAMLAETCVRGAAATTDALEREHLLDVAAVAGWLA